ncbi:hypothetical protein ES708_17908 [subsurface metagenome]
MSKTTITEAIKIKERKGKGDTMGNLELALLTYYRSRTLKSLTAQETDEYLYLEVKLALEPWQQMRRGTP